MTTTPEDLVITKTCPMCGKQHSVQVKRSDYKDWQNGKFIQDAFPYVDQAWREILITGIDPTCWDRLFPPEED